MTSLVSATEVSWYSGRTPAQARRILMAGQLGDELGPLLEHEPDLPWLDGEVVRVVTRSSVVPTTATVWTER